MVDLACGHGLLAHIMLLLDDSSPKALAVDLDFNENTVGPSPRVVEAIRGNPYSRRHLVCAWNAGELEKMALPPCHLLYQFYVANGRLSSQLLIRSSDSFLGLPYNTASLAVLTMMLAQQCDLEPGEIIITTGDTHIYSNHLEQVREQLGRVPRTLPTLNILRRPDSIYDYRFEDFELLDYLSVLDNILHPYRITRALKLTPEVRRRARDLAGQMGIGDKLQRHAGDLSQGEKQRAAICRALLPQPKLILADEATGNLDPDNKLHILDLLFEAVDQHGATLLAVTHDHELLPRFDRLVDFNEFRGWSAA